MTTVLHPAMLLQDALAREDFPRISQVADLLLASYPGESSLLELKILALTRQGRWEEALKDYATLAKSGERAAIFYRDFALTLKQTGQFTAAMEQCREALRRDPSDPESYYLYAQCLQLYGHHEAARDAFAEVLRRDPQHENVIYSLGLLKLLLSGMTEGYDGYAHRFSFSKIKPPLHAFPRWQGEPIAGKSLLIWTEQGAGDVFMFAGFFRYLLSQQPKALAVAMYRQTIPLLARSFPEICFFPYQEEPESATGITFDAHAPLGDLLQFCLPHWQPAAHGPYLRVDEAQKRAARADLDARLGPGRKIGISWSTTNAHTGIVRNIPLTLWEPLLRVPGCAFLSLQHGPAAADVQRLPEGLRVYSPEIQVMADHDALAALTAALDEVICVQNTVVHLAGALGVPATLLLSAASDYRWGLARADNPWYACVSIERQEMPMVWEPVIARVATALAARVGG